MSLVNYSSSYILATSAPQTFYHHPAPPPQPVPPPYSYPRPQKPFVREDYGPPQRPLPQPFGFYNPTTVVPPEYSQIGGTDDGTRTRVHAVIDYDDDYDGIEDNVPVAPIQGPIYLKNGTVPVVPLYSHSVLRNGSFIQIPILWTALSVALGFELRGDYIRGVPCIKRHQQLYCPKAGNTYPLDRIELFIDENKALMKRMYGEFNLHHHSTDEYGRNIGSTGKHRKRSSSSGKIRDGRGINQLPPGVPDMHFLPELEQYTDIAKERNIRQIFRKNQTSDTGRTDACESKVEIVTPYWASNSAGKVRAIVNTQHFEQAVHQEVCAKSRTGRCLGDCGCEQKYKWHRLLAYDPEDDCKGIFMDWFLFPSCCVCRCASTNSMPKRS